MRRTRLVWLAILASLFAPRAHAFCGFYVSGAEGSLFNHATLVVLMREGTTTVLSMQNDYQGPPEDFALVVPVPVVLQRENVRTLPREVFTRIERLSAPRLVEYWEQDPCTPRPALLGSLGTVGHGAGRGSGSGYGSGATPLVRVEARFAVGEYDVVILSADDSGALETWLRHNRYRIPDGAAAVLRPYVEAGTKFFVARVDVDRVRFEQGRAVLSPLRVHYTSEELALPVRLGLLNSSGTQDLIVTILARNQRYRVANRPNVEIPTNLDVAPAARERFGELYAALFDRVLEHNPGAVVTEYAWQATSCDPCPPDALLSDSDIATLGGDVALGVSSAPGGTGAVVPQVRLMTPSIRGELSRDVVRRVLQRHLNELRFCYEQQLTAQPSLAGQATLRFVIDPSGAVTRAEIADSTLRHPAMEACLAGAVRRWSFPSSDALVSVDYPIDLSTASRSVMGFGGGGFGGGFGGGMGSSLVLTRLHTRYGRDGLDADLVFERAEPIAGGREVRDPDGALEHGARPGAYNNFQARYAIRHPWEGEIDCEAPRRGIWGGPPEGGGSRVAPATGLGHARRGALRLEELVPSGLGDLAPAAHAQAPAGAIEEAAPAEGPADPTPAGALQPAAQASGCACRASAARSGPTWLLLVSLAVALRSRRRRA